MMTFNASDLYAIKEHQREMDAAVVSLIVLGFCMGLLAGLLLRVSA